MVPLKIKIPDGFLEEEVRCGYSVSRQMKEVWAVELDLLAEFIKVCEKYHLTYYALGGTLLGAVRHQGFIPWDDDIDLLMPRKDYNKLLEIGSKEFQNPYFFSTPETEYRFWRTHVQIRNSDTTGAAKDDEHRNNNKGIFIDVFPLDTVPDTKEQRDAHRKQLRNISKYVRSDMDLASFKEKDNALKYFFRNLTVKLMVHDQTYAETFQKFNQACAQYSGQNFQAAAHDSLNYREAQVWRKEDFTSCQQVEFEFLKICIPSGFQAILAKNYGDDFMQLPENPPDTTHGTLFFDTENSYKKYYAKENKK